MQASRPQPAMLEGLSRFLVEHEPHGEGFDVAHPDGAGSGHVSITCRGCGARHDYATATLEIERELTIEPLEPAAAQPNGGMPVDAAGRPKAAERVGPGPAPAPARRRPSRLVTAGLLALAVAALAFAIVRLANDGGGNAATAPAKPKASPIAASNPTPPPPAGRRGSGVVPIATPAFALRAPRGWVRDTSRGGLLIHPRGRRSPSLQVFFQRRPGLSLRAMAARTQTFLRSRGAREISAARRLRVRGDLAFRISIRGPGGALTATGIRHRATRYLLLVSRGAAQGRAAKEVAAVARSFRPR